jgi:hypothetical protein
MKIAVCLSGQFRTGEYALPSLLHYFKGYDCDYFCHAWQDNNMRVVTPIRFRKMVDTVDNAYPKEYIESTLDTLLKPKKILVEENSTVVTSKIWHGSWSQLFYSLMIANWLKKEYETENKFKYDLVVKTRYDFVYPPNTTFNPKSFKTFEPLTEHLEIFTNSMGRMYMEYSRINASDTFFYGTSTAMDIFSDIYRYLKWRNLEINMQDFDSPGPGCLMSEFAAKHNIRITSAGEPGDVIYRQSGIGLDVVNDYQKLSELNRAIYI